MPTDRIALLVAGAVLVLLALAASVLARFGRKLPGLTGLAARSVVGVVGAGLIAWVLWGAPGLLHPQRLAVGAAATPAGAGAPAQSASQSAPQSASQSASGQPAAQGLDPVILAGSAFDACAAPAQPAAPPSGATASRGQMQASQSSAKAFDAATNVYLACLDRAAVDFNKQYGRYLTQGSLRAIEGLRDKMHNSAVDTDEAVAGRFNQQLRIYKARGRSS